MTTKNQVQIVDGPSAAALIDALKYAHGENQMIVTFTTTKSHQNPKELIKKKMLISGLEHENDSGFSFNFKARVMDEVHSMVKGYYNARTRSGVFEL